MVKEMTRERRKAVRAQRILSIQYKLAQTKRRNADKKWYLSTTHDMSISGLSFLSEVPYQVDEVLELQVVMSGILDVFKGYGKVVRVQRKTTGAYFLIAVKFIDFKPGQNRVRARAAKK